MLERRPALARGTAAPAAFDGVRLSERPHTGRVNLRGDPSDRAFMAAVGRALDLVLPTDPNAATTSGGVTAIWLGPDEWLLSSTTEEPEDLEARVRTALRPLGGSATDVSAQRIGLRLTGARVRDVLAKGCSIDLHPRAFGRGSSAQTMLGQAGVVLLALSDAGDVVVLVRSSFAGYLADWLLDAALEFTPTPNG